MKIATFYDHILDISRQEGISTVEALKLAREMGVEAVEASGNNIVGREDEMGQELAMADMAISTVPAKLLVIPGFFAEEDSPEQREAQLVCMEEGVNKLAELAAGYGVSLVMEEYDSELAPYSTMEGVRRFLDRCPGLSAAFDSGNFRFAAQDLLEAYDLLKDRIAHVHLKDRAYSQSNGEEPKMAVDGVPMYPAPVGGGDLPLEKLMDLLKRDGYDGIYTIEHYGSNMTLDYLRQSVAWVKEQLGKK